MDGAVDTAGEHSHDAEIRKLLRVDLLILDDFALQALDPLDTADVYEPIVERHWAASTIVTSHREPAWPDGVVGRGGGIFG